MDENTGFTPLHCIAELKSTVEDHRKIMAFLLTNKANINAKIDKQKHSVKSPLFLAVQNSNIDIATFLLKNGANCNISSESNNTTLLHMVVATDNYNLTALALKNKYLRAKINNYCDIKGQTALCLAVYKKNHDIAKLLIDHGADVNRCSKDEPGCVFMYAMGVNDVKMTKLLVENGFDLEMIIIPEIGMRPLHSAVSERKYEIAELLIKNGANVMARFSKDKVTPLHMSVTSEGDDLSGNFLLKLLIKYGADVNAKMTNGDIPLHLAARHGHDYRAQILIQNESNVNAIMEDEMRPLHWASKNGHFKIVEMLVEAGADVNATQESHGWTPLHFAVHAKHLKMVKYLVKSGARLDVKDRIKGGTPIVHASVLGLKEIIAFLFKKSTPEDLNYLKHTIQNLTL